MSESLRQWLDRLELGRFEAQFVEQEVELADLPDLSDEDLKELGLPLGPRRRLLREAANLRAPEPTSSPQGESQEQEGPPAAKETVEPVTGGHEAQRRQLTVLFCDLVGSTELSRRLDPEDMRNLIRRYQDTVAGAVTRFNGHVAKFLGDGVLAYFGWPMAFEDAPVRAVTGGLEAIEAVQALAGGDDASLRVRVGIATGNVVVGDLVGETTTDAEAVTGETPNLAARLQSEAEPGEVVIDGTTLRLLGNAFTIDPLGSRELKGYDVPVACWRVTGRERVESRFAATRASAHSEFVGRDHELSLLRDRWSLSRDGEGQVVVVSGEAGIGKSRLVETLMSEISDRGSFRLRFQFSPYHVNSPLYPFIQHLERAAGFTPNDSDEERLGKLERLLRLAVDDPSVATQLLANMLSLPFEHRFGPLTMTAQQVRRSTVRAILEQISGLAGRRPTILLFEDAHWIDPTSQDLLEMLVELTGNLPLMIIVTQRPEWQPSFVGQSNLSMLHIGRFSRQHSNQIISEIAGREIPAEVVDRIIERTDGIPLFVEELTRSLLESVEGGQLDANDVPESLQGTLLARLDRLTAGARELARVGSVIGREFSLDLVAHVADKLTDQIDAIVQELLEARVITRGSVAGEEVVAFRHALIRDAAYQAQLLSRRRETHERIARNLINHFPETAEIQPELIARHSTEAGIPVQAFEYWMRAGQLAASRFANIEAVDHFRGALTELERGTFEDKSQCELSARLAMAVPLVASTGYASDEVERNFRRAEQLCLELGDTDNLFSVRRGLWNFLLDRPDYATCADLAETLLKSAEEADDAEETMLAQRARASAKFYTGDLTGSLDAARAGIEIAERRSGAPDHAKHGEDGAVTSRQYLSWAEFLLGRPDTGLAQGLKAVEEAHAQGYPLNEAFARSMLTILYRFRREIPACMAETDRLVSICDEHDLIFWRAMGRVTKGWAIAMTGDVETGLKLARAGSREWRSTGARIHGPHWLSIEADICAHAGRIEEGMRAVELAVEEARQTGESWTLSDIERHHGRLLLADGNRDGANTACKQAIAIARDQGALWFELRAATDLARLQVENGEKAQAGDLLRGVLDRLSEGETTADVRDARDILARVDGP